MKTFAKKIGIKEEDENNEEDNMAEEYFSV